MAELKGIEFQITGSSDKASNSIKTLIDGLKDLKAALDSTQKAAKGSGTFKELAASIKDFKEALGGGFERYKKFAQSLEDIAAAAELLGEKTHHIADLATAMESLSNTKISGSAFKNLADGMAAVSFTTKDISKESLDNLERMADALAKLAGVDLKGLGSAMRSVSSGKSLEPPTPLDNEIRDTIEAGDKVDLLRLKLDALRKSMNAAFEKGDLSGAIRIRQQIASVEAEIEKLTTATEEVTPEIDKFDEAMSRADEMLGKAGDALKKVASGMFKLLSMPFRELGKSVGGIATKLGDVLRGFKRIVGYRIIRSIIREITQGFTEGIKSVYQWSKVVGGPVNKETMTFAGAMDDMATSLKYFKGGIGAAAAPLISALAPALRAATDAAIQLLNIINQLMALLTGQSGWIRATRQAEEYEEAVGGAGGAAKEALRYLAPFDELNVLPSQKDGGGGGGTDDIGEMFEEIVDFEEGIKDFVDKIKKAIEESDWKGLGELLGGKINELLDMVDFAALGAWVGEKINALFSTQYWTLETINFQEIGKKVAEFLNSALSEIDFTTVGASVTQTFTIIGDFIIGAFEEIDWNLVGSSLRDFFVGAITQITNWFNKQDWEQLGKDLIESICEFFDGLSIGDIAQALCDLIEAAVNAAVGLLKGLGAAIFGDETYDFDLDLSLGKFDLFGGESGSSEDLLGAALAGALTGTLLVCAWNPGVGLVLAATLALTLGMNDISFYDKIPQEKLDEFKQHFQDQLEQQKITVPVTDIELKEDTVLEVEGKLTKVTDELDEHFREVNLTAMITDLEQRDPMLYQPIKSTAEIIDLEQRGIFDVDASAHLTKVDKSDLSSKDKTIGVTAQYKWVIKSALSELQRSLGVTAIYKWVKKGELNDDQRSLGITGVYKWVAKGLLTEAQKTINTISQYTKADKSKLTGAMTTVNTTSKYTKTDFSALTAADREVNTKALIKSTQIDSSINYGGKIKVDAIINITDYTGLTAVDVPKANGGAFTNSGWKPITSYAGGGFPYGGQIFRARENGNPELVGTLNGSTAVMNNNQIVASVSAGVARAIAGIRFQLRGLNPQTYQSEDGVNEDTLYRAFSRALADADLGGDIELDGEVLYRSMVNRNRRNTRMTGVNALG